ncbi:alpha/beta hydrolase [Halobacteriales archaeon QS_4_69_31]|nr:MAG: alpha/beta hydrolase [Halobacteriales archaeon QS_4_69_31]
MQTVTSADGTEIAYETHDDNGGSPLILLHGGGTRRYWDSVLDRFAEECTVVLPDRRARGDSGDGNEYGLRREVEDALAVVDAVDGDPALYGHSFGGLQAIEAAREADVSALVAYEPAILVGDYREEAALADRMEAHIEAGERREAMKLHLREVLHDEVGDAEFAAWLDEWPGWPGCVEHVELDLRMNRAVEQYRLPDALDVDAPALLLTGSEGPAHLRDSVRATRDAIPDSRLVEFEGVGHNGPVAAADRVTAEVRDFLATVLAEEAV